MSATQLEAAVSPPPRNPLAFDVGRVTDVLWTLTDRCNLACSYCAVVPHHGPPPQEPARADLDRIIRQLSRLPSLESLILSGGEAVLSHNLDYVLDRTSFATIRYLITNGTALHPNAKALLCHHKPRVMISLDSTEAAINALSRGIAALPRTLNALDWLIEHDFFTVVIIVLTRFNAPSLQTTLRNLYSRGVRNILIQQLHCASVEMGNFFKTASPTLADLRAVSKVVDDMRVTHPDICIDDNEVCFFERRQSERGKKCSPGVAYLPQRLFMCGAGYDFFAIKTNGDVIPCNALLSCVGGNLLREDIETILLQSPEFTRLRRLRAYRVDIVPGCNGCTLNPICDGGCRADVFHLTGEIGNPHPNCPHNAGAVRP